MSNMLHNIDIWWNMLIKFSKQIGNSFARIINTKVNSKPWQTSEMQLFPQVVTGFTGEFRILPYIWDTYIHTYIHTYIQLFAKLVKNEKPFIIFAKTSTFDVWQDSEYVSELTSRVKDVSFLNQFKYQRWQNLLLGKNKKKESTELQNNWTKMLLNKTNS